jgi:hypothetical protein
MSSPICCFSNREIPRILLQNCPRNEGPTKEKRLGKGTMMHLLSFPRHQTMVGILVKVLRNNKFNTLDSSFVVEGREGRLEKGPGNDFRRSSDPIDVQLK